MADVFWPGLLLLVGIYAVVAYLLVAKYRRTRDKGLLWLFFLLILWPVWTHDVRPVSRLLFVDEGEVWQHGGVLQYLFVNAFLTLIAVAMLHRKKSETSEAG